MIAANELRIGNWALHRPISNEVGVARKISGVLGGFHMGRIYFDAATNESTLNHFLEPIPLTEEILVKAGFVDSNNGYRATGAEIVYRKEDVELWESSRWSEPQQWTVVVGKFRPVIKYLHQLQNLYFTLTQTELNFKL